MGGDLQVQLAAKQLTNFGYMLCRCQRAQLCCGTVHRPLSSATPLLERWSQVIDKEEVCIHVRLKLYSADKAA